MIFFVIVFISTFHPFCVITLNCPCELVYVPMYLFNVLLYHFHHFSFFFSLICFKRLYPSQRIRGVIATFVVRISWYKIDGKLDIKSICCLAWWVKGDKFVHPGHHLSSPSIDFSSIKMRVHHIQGMSPVPIHAKTRNPYDKPYCDIELQMTQEV